MFNFVTVCMRHTPVSDTKNPWPLWYFTKFFKTFPNSWPTRLTWAQILELHWWNRCSLRNSCVKLPHVQFSMMLKHWRTASAQKFRNFSSLPWKFSYQFLNNHDLRFAWPVLIDLDIVSNGHEGSIKNIANF